MDRLWTPWRYAYITGAETAVQDEPDPAGPAPAAADKMPLRKGVPKALDAWPGEDTRCVFCNLIRSVIWGLESGMGEAAERAGHVVARLEHCFVCLNAYPYSSGHVLIVPYLHTDSLAKVPVADAEELIRIAQRVESAQRQVYHPDGINLGMNLGEAAGAGVAEHVHLHILPRWFGDTNFMTAVAETRVLPETLDITWERLRKAFNSLT
jgi:ATP adenylyltransferase